MVQPLEESQGSSPLQDHGSWLVCEVALRHHEALDASSYGLYKEALHKVNIQKIL